MQAASVAQSAVFAAAVSRVPKAECIYRRNSTPKTRCLQLVCTFVCRITVVAFERENGLSMSEAREIFAD